ncbi:MAG: SusC/RagA family TonB-linked outer membrane protein [Flammeovirgaceae bacterium]
MKKVLLLMLILLCYTAPSWAQEITVSGTIKDEAGDGLPGATVVIKGTNDGAVADIDGKYTIKVPNAEAILVFNYVGFTKQEIKVGAQKVIDVVLKNSTVLEEVVVTGYGDFDKNKFTGSAAVVGSKEIENVPMANFEQMLQGQAPGLLVQSGSGQPGAAAAVTLRGINSISSGTTPLYVIDGVPVSSAQFASLNPNDFESVNVLKDAAAAAIYGSRGANGVIVITTKKGKAGKTVFNYNFQYGQTAQLTRDDFLPVMNSNQKIDFELLTGGGPLDGLSEAEINELRAIDTDWAEEIFQTGRLMSHEISASGGNENTTFYISGSVFSQEGHVITTGLDRYTLRANVLNQSGNFNFGVNFTASYSDQTFTREGDAFIGSPLNAFYWTNPYETVFDENGDYTVVRTGQPNAVQELVENPRNREDVRAVANIKMGYDLPFVKGLSINTNWGVDFRDRQTRTFLDPQTNAGQQATSGSGSLSRGDQRDVQFIGTNSINYETEFGTDHTLSVGLFQEIVYGQVESFGFTGFGIVGRLENEASITAGSVGPGGVPQNIPTVTGTAVENTLASFFATANYGYKGKYFLNGAIRRDGSSRFGSDNRFATFASIGASWVLSEEAFLDGVSFVDNLKLRASFGSTGNQAIGDFQYAALVNTFTANPYDGEPGKTLANIPDPTIQWESNQSFNVGIDHSLFNGKVSGSIDYYRNDTKNLLMNAQLSRTTGFASQLQNVGQIRNSGIEVSLNVTPINSGGFTWDINANFSYNKNEVIELADGQDIVSGTSIIREGEDINSNWVVPFVGVDPATGDALYRDINGNVTNVYNANDARVTGTRTAPYFGGFTNKFRYKGFEFIAFFNWVSGNDVFNNERINIENPNFFVDGMSSNLLNAWQEPGQVTDVPRIRTINGLTTNPFQSNSSRYIEDGSYIRLRNVQLSYTLPAATVQKIGLSNVRVYVQGQNLWTSTAFTGADPEKNDGFFLGAVYPALRTYTVGLNVGF